MGEREELSKLLESSNEPTEPEGVIVHSADGRLFFLSKEDADRTTIPESRLYTAFRLMRSQEPRKAEKDALTKDCIDAWIWLEHHSPNSARWRRVCLTYFDTCV